MADLTKHSGGVEPEATKSLPALSISEIRKNLAEWERQVKTQFVSGDLNNQQYLNFYVKDLRQDLGYLYAIVRDLLQTLEVLDADDTLTDLQPSDGKPSNGDSKAQS